MIRTPHLASIVFALVALLIAPISLAGTPTELDEASTTVFAVTSTNNLLVNSLSSATYTGSAGQEGYANPTTGSNVLVDGAFGPATPSTTQAAVATLNVGFVAVFNLNLAASPGGYFVTSIESFGGWNDNGRDQQSYTVAYQPAAGGAFVDIGTVNYNPPGATVPTNSKVTLTNLGIDTVAIRALRFTINAQENGHCGYREFSAFGTPIAPVNSLPTITPATGFFENSVNVTVTQTEAGATTYYTTDGSEPTSTNGTALVGTSATFSINTNTTRVTNVRAQTFKAGNQNASASNTYTGYNAAVTVTGDLPGLRCINYETNGQLLPHDPITIITQQRRVPGFNGNDPANHVSVTPRSRDTSFGYRFTGYINIPTKGIYRFFTNSDDGSRLFLDNALIVENNFGQGYTERSGDVALHPGKHAFRVEFSQGGGGFGITSRYSAVGSTTPIDYDETLTPTGVFTTEEVIETPVITLGGGGNSFTGTGTVTITSVPANATIYYTTDGTTPTPDSNTGTLVSGGSFTINATSTVKAIAKLPGAFDGGVATATFTRNASATDAPKLLFAKATSSTQVDVVYDIAMGASAAVSANYAITGGVSATGAVLDADTKTVHLTVNPALDPNVTYTVTASNVSSAAGALIGSTNKTKFRMIPNGVYFERFYDPSVNGSMNSLVTLPAFLADNPNNRELLSTFDFPEGRYGDNYGSRLRAFLTAPETGVYTFRISSDDNSRLFVSTDGTAANKVLIAGVPNWTPYRNFTTFVEAVDDGVPENDQFGSVTLTAGQSYYVEALMSEGGGGDHLTVQWAIPSTPAAFTDLPNSLLAPFSSVGITPPTVPGNGMLRERYDGIPGGAVSDLTNSAKYPGSPDVVDFVPTFESPQAPAQGDNYGMRLSGFYTAPATGNFNFYIAGDDDCQLWFSPNDNPANATLICNKVGGPNGNRDWQTGNGRKSADIALVQGQRYYMFALLKEGGGGDGVAVTVLPTGTDPVVGTTPPIPGADLTPGVVPLQIVGQTFSKRVRFGTSTTLAVTAVGGLSKKTYQWFKAGVPIVGATASTLPLNAVTGTDTATYSVEVSGSPDGLSLSVAFSDPIQVQVYADISLDTATLTQTYNATNRVVTATTAPAALPYAVTYNTNPTAVNAGTYAVVASATGGVEAIANGTLTVNQAPLTVSANAATREYGQPEPTFTAVVTGFFSPDTNALITGAASFTTTAVVNSNIGTYPITPALGTLAATGGNYSFPGANFVNGVLTITKATNASVAVNAQGATIFYDGQSHVASSVTTPAGLTVSYTYNGSPTAPVNAGVYNVVGTISDNNADLATDIPGNGTLTISKVALTATGTLLTRTYGDTTPILPAAPVVGTDYTLSGLVNNEGVGVVSGAPTLSTTAVAATTGPDTTGSPAGDYVITLASNMGLSATNYDVTTFQPGTLRINKRPVNVQAQSISLEYGQPSPQTLAYTVVPASLAPSDTPAIAITGGEPGVSSTRTPTSPVGVYPITLTPGTLTFSPNYQLGTTANGTITVTQSTTAAATVPNTTVTYDGAPHGITPVITPAGLNATVTYNGSATVPTNAGSYAVVATINDSNAAGNPFGNGTLTINKATAILSFFNLFQTENGTPRPVSVVTSPPNLAVNVTYNGSTTAPTLPGTYAVVATINETNYQGTANATLRVGGPPPLITSPLAATPNPVQVGKTVTFSIAATHPLNLPITITYDYGDGVSDSTGVHVYTFPQIATVIASVSDGISTITSMVQVLVVSAASPEGDLDGDGILNSIDTDDDGDGLSDIFEDAIGSSPLDAGNLPLDDPNQAKNPGPLDVKKMAIKLSFSRPSTDAIAIAGTFPVKAGFIGLNKKLVVDVGGVIRSFTLGPKNSAISGSDAVKLLVKAKKGVVSVDQAAKYAIKISKGSFSSTLADDGLGNETAKNKATTVRVDVLFNGQYLRKLVPQIYTAKQGSSGRTK